MIWLVEITDYSGGAEVVRRYATAGYRTRPDDTPASTHYPPRVQSPANYSRSVRGEGGRATVGAGEVVLANPDGALDGLFDAVDGRALRVLTVAPGGAYSTATVVLRATMEQAEYTWQRVRIKLRDRVAELAERPVQATKFAGTCINGTVKNAEGRPEDVGGQPKPRAFGRPYSVPAAPADVFNLVYQISTGVVASIAVYDQGVALTNAGDVATLADLYAATISSGQYRTCLATGYFRLGGAPAGAITADVVQGATAADRTAAQVMLALADIAGITDIDTAAFTALGAANSAEIGLWVDSERDIASCMDDVARSVGAWWGFDRFGRLTCGRLEAPTGTPLQTYTRTEILDRGQGLERMAGEIPAYRVTLRYRRNWQPLSDADLAGSVSVEDRASLAQEWRTVTATDASVQTTHLLASEVEVETLLVDAAAAQAEADRRLTLCSVRRDVYRVPLSSGYATARDLGDEIRLTVPRFGLDAGANAIVLGITENAETSITELEVRT